MHFTIAIVHSGSGRKQERGKRNGQTLTNWRMSPLMAWKRGVNLELAWYYCKYRKLRFPKAALDVINKRAIFLLWAYTRDFFYLLTKKTCKDYHRFFLLSRHRDKTHRTEAEPAWVRRSETECGDCWWNVFGIIHVKKHFLSIVSHM